jgi:hypothetical protein
MTFIAHNHATKVKLFLAPPKDGFGPHCCVGGQSLFSPIAF